VRSLLIAFSGALLGAAAVKVVSLHAALCLVTFGFGLLMTKSA